MSIKPVAQWVAENAPNARAVTFEGGYLVDSQGVCRHFPPGTKVKERRRNGRCEWCQTRFPDGSVLEFRWSEALGARYKVLAPVVI